MKQKGVLVLTLVTVAAVAVAALALHRSDAGAAPTERQKLFAELDQRVNDVAEITVQKDGKSATIRREGGTWKLTDRGGYPAKFDQVKQTVVRLAELAIEEQKTGRAENHEKLGLKLPDPARPAEVVPAAGDETGAENPGPPASEAALVTLKDASGKSLAALVIGKTEWRGSTQKVYVRRASEDQVYLCSGRLDINADPATWIDKDLLKLDSERVQDVVITHADGEEVRIGRSATNHTQFQLENLPPGEKERYEGIASGVAQALSSLTLEDVRPAAEVDFAKEPLAHARFRCHDGLELVLETAKQDDKTWVKIAATYVEPPAPPPGEPAEPSADGEPKPAPETDAPKQDVGKEAEELSARFAPWAFAIPQWKVDVLARHMKDLLAEPPKPGADPGDGAELFPEGAETEDGTLPEFESPAPTDDEGAGEAPAPEEKPDEDEPPGG